MSGRQIQMSVPLRLSHDKEDILVHEDGQRSGRTDGSSDACGRRMGRSRMKMRGMVDRDHGCLGEPVVCLSFS